MILFNVTRDGWCPGAVEFLVSSWLPMRTVEIAEALGCSPHAIIGKANRIGLSKKPHPGQKHANQTPRVYQPSKESRHRQQLEPTLAPLASVAPVAKLSTRHQSSLGGRPPMPAAVAAPAFRLFAPVRVCCWPIGEPKTRGFRFCDAVADPGKPYCLTHVKIAYIRVRDRREDQDAA
jgi:GcrA cell cycle regulator